MLYSTYTQAFQTPFLISGDFNFEPNTLEWQLMTQVFSFVDSSQSNIGCTYCQANPLAWTRTDRKIDYIFSRASIDQRITASASRTSFHAYNDQPLSDHYGVESDFETESRNLFENSQFNFTRYFFAGKFIKQIAILNNVKAKLENHGDSDLWPYINYAEQLIDRLKRESPQDPWIQTLLEK